MTNTGVRLIGLAALVLHAASVHAGGETVPPGYSMARTGDVHDFDYFAGAWTTKQRKLKARGVGSNDWEEFPATLCMTPYLDGRSRRRRTPGRRPPWSPRHRPAARRRPGCRCSGR